MEGEDKQSYLEANMKSPSEGNTSSFKTFFNSLNALSGVGILSISYALSSGGWLSLLLLLVIAIAAFYSCVLMKRCMEIDASIKTYPDIGERAFGNIGKTIALVIMNLELYLVVTGFLISEGDNLHKLFPQMKFEAYGIEVGGRVCFVTLIALIILPSVWLDNLSILSYVSATGVIASLIILVSILWVGAFDGIGFQKKGELLNWSGIPTSVSLYGFCYCAHPVFPALYLSMKEKHHYARVQFLCFLCTTGCYASMAIIGYLMFGSTVDSQITLNLPTNKLSSKIAIYTTLVNPVSKYALMLSPIASAAESLFPSYQKKRFIRILIRTSIVASQVIVALTVPFFGYIMSLVGAFLSINASITFPCLCYLRISGPIVRSELIIIVGALVLSILITIFGTYTSLVQIVHRTIIRY